MRATYVDFTCDILKKEAVGTPIYTNHVAQQLGTAYQLEDKEAAAAHKETEHYKKWSGSS